MDEIISYTMCAVKVRNAKLRNYLKAHFHSGKFSAEENFVKCDWPSQTFRRKKILKLKIFNF